MKTETWNQLNHALFILEVVYKSENDKLIGSTTDKQLSLIRRIKNNLKQLTNI